MFWTPSWANLDTIIDIAMHIQIMKDNGHYVEFVNGIQRGQGPLPEGPMLVSGPMDRLGDLLEALAQTGVVSSENDCEGCHGSMP